MIGVLIITAVAAAVPAQSPPTVSQWAQQDAETRRIALVGAVEGVLLATSALDGLSIPVNTDCFSMQPLEAFEEPLKAVARTSPGMPLVKALIELPQCARRKVAK